MRKEAIKDLTAIWNYRLLEYPENQADKYYETIKIACKNIGENPNIEKVYSEISNHLFGLKSGKHIIFYYQVSEEEIEVVRILPERMDLKSRLTM